MKKMIKAGTSNYEDIEINDAQDIDEFVVRKYNRPTPPYHKYRFILDDDVLWDIYNEKRKLGEDALNEFMVNLKHAATPSCFKSIKDRMYSMMDRYHTHIPAFRASEEIIEDLTRVVADTQSECIYPTKLTQRTSSVVVYFDISKQDIRNTDVEDFCENVKSYISYLLSLPEVGAVEPSIDSLCDWFVRYQENLDDKYLWPYRKGSSLHIQILPAKPYPGGLE